MCDTGIYMQKSTITSLTNIIYLSIHIIIKTFCTVCLVFIVCLRNEEAGIIVLASVLKMNNKQHVDFQVSHT